MSSSRESKLPDDGDDYEADQPPPSATPTPILAPQSEPLKDYVNETFAAMYENNFQDDELWDFFQDAFRNYDRKTFALVETASRTKAKTFLRSHGVYLPLLTTRHEDNSKYLADLLNESYEQNLGKWPQEELRNIYEKGKPIFSKELEYLIRKVLQLGSTTPFPVEPNTIDLSQRDRASVLPPTSPQLPGTRDKTPATVYPDPGTAPVPALAPVPQLPSQPLRQPYNPSNQSLHERKHQGSQQVNNWGKEIATLAKLIRDDQLYSGENDAFDHKLAVFKDNCSIAGLPQEGYAVAYSMMLKGLARQHYQNNLARATGRPSFEIMVHATRSYFEGPEYKRAQLSKWNSTTLQSVMSENEGKSPSECLPILTSRLQYLRNSLDPDLQTDRQLYLRLLHACEGVPACQHTLSRPPTDLIALVNDLNSSAAAWEKVNGKNAEAYYTDRSYKYRGKYQGSGQRQQSANSTGKKGKNCFVCDLPGCWSTNHTKEEVQKAKEKYFRQTKKNLGSKFDFKRYNAVVRQYFGSDSDSEVDTSEIEQLMADAAIEQDEAKPAEEVNEQYFTSFGAVDEPVALANALSNQISAHALTLTSALCEDDDVPVAVLQNAYSTVSRYNADLFHGILIDTGAARVSTAGYQQYLAYARVSKAQLDKGKAGATSVKFGIGNTSSLGTVNVVTPVGAIEFHVMQADTPFLLSIADMDKLGCYLNNLTNQLVLGKKTFPVIRRFGHPFFVWENFAATFIVSSISTIECFLSETELRRLHKRFGHPSVEKLSNLLTRAGYKDPSIQATLEKLVEVCKQCQKHGAAPQRFRFSLLNNEEVDFNHTIFVDVMVIEGESVLHVVDLATRFSAARWLTSMTTKNVWYALQQCWIDTYLGPPDIITNDAGSNFTSREFKGYATSMGISCKTVPVEAHWSIGIVERAHASLRRAYKVIREDLGAAVSKTARLQMAVKACNDTAGPEGLVPTLLVFGAYPRITEIDPPAPSVATRAATIKKAMAEVQQLRAQRTVSDALRARNGPSTERIHDLPINSDVLVWREGQFGHGEWTGPYKLLSVSRETCKVQTAKGPTDFRSTSVKPYLQDAVPKPSEDLAPRRPVVVVESRPDPTAIDCRESDSKTIDQVWIAVREHEGGLENTMQKVTGLPEEEWLSRPSAIPT